MNKLLRILFPTHYSITTKCRGCGVVLNKSQMIRTVAHGWFCCQDEADTAWFDSQI